MDTRPYDGVSLLPLIEDTMNERPRPIAFESKGSVALIDNRYKCIYVPGGDYELYDIIEDPGEKRDIAAEQPIALENLRVSLNWWRNSCRHSNRGEDY